ncbi:hypothetical protein BKCO1_100066 [Neofusicoccum parvum]|nr:hypothetical protein BKCO1_100066 [Neofusicoccum parvum]
MSLTAPYDNAMRLGQGFNTYTQEIRIENAVSISKKPQPAAKLAAPKAVKNDTLLAVPTKDVPAVVTPPVTPPPANKGESQSEPSTPSPAPRKSAADAQNVADLPGVGELQNRALPSPAASILDFDDSVETAVFSLPDMDGAPPNQTVTYSTRAIDNVSDIMDALNISTAMSIKYGTIHGNASAGFVNEGKVLDSQLNYIVSVKVNNENCLSSSHHHSAGDMAFNPVDDMPPEHFTDVYGDAFISGFLEGGEFSAVISIQVADRSKLRRVKQAVDLALAVGPTPVSVGASESVDSSHAEVLQDTEITISVNWTGGGDIKKPEVPWTLNTVVAVANAFPSMVARSSSKTAAVLTRYESLRSFQAWKWRMEAKEKGWVGRLQQLNYTPCSLYTAELFDALMAYKKLWKKIGGSRSPRSPDCKNLTLTGAATVLKDPSKWQARKPVAKIKSLPDGHDILYASPTEVRKASSSSAPGSPSTLATDMQERKHTFDIEDPFILEGRSLKELNTSREPVPVDPVALNEARLLCRQAMTLITEEAARLVSHPDLAYADFSSLTQRTKLKRPNYAYPEVLAARLPVPLRNDALPTAFPASAAARLTQAFARGDDLACVLVGDEPHPHRSYKAFTSLAMALNPSGEAAKEGAASAAAAADDEPPVLARLSLHSYHHHVLSLSGFSKASAHAIGGIGFRFAGGDGERMTKKKAAAEKEDGCTHHAGAPGFHTLSSGRPSWASLELSGHPPGAGGRPPVEIVAVEVYYVPRSHRVAGLAFFDAFAGKVTERLAWRQWECEDEGRRQPPDGLVTVRQEPPRDGARWCFAGLTGEWDESVWGSVLARVGAVWRRVEEERDGERDLEVGL